MLALEFVHDFRNFDAPDYVIERYHLSSLDLLSIAAAATIVRFSGIIREHSC